MEFINEKTAYPKPRASISLKDAFLLYGPLALIFAAFAYYLFVFKAERNFILYAIVYAGNWAQIFLPYWAIILFFVGAYYRFVDEKIKMKLYFVMALVYLFISFVIYFNAILHDINIKAL